MASHDELVQAKRTLGQSLLRAGAEGGVVGSRRTLLVSQAIASAGHNVHAVGIGRKTSNGIESDELCVRVYVVQKLPLSLLSPHDRIPESIDGIPTDIIESAPAFLSDEKLGTITSSACTLARKQRQRPVTAGISAGHFAITAGTLGYFCRSTRDGDDHDQIHALSNNHVFANVDKALPMDALYQPGAADGGSAHDRFAEFTRAVPIHMGGQYPNRVDAAIGRLLPGTEYIHGICTVGQVTGATRAMLGMPVCKHGRTTGYTEGRVADIDYDALVGMDHQNPRIVALFADQILIERDVSFPAIGLGGDSGSLVVERGTKAAVGLYFAGPEDGTYGIPNHIHAVLDELQVQLI